MNIFRRTPFAFAAVPGRLSFPAHSLTLVVKGTFDLSPGAEAVLARDQPFATGDEFYPDDPDMQGGPRYDSDFAFFKPRSDLLLVGKCHAPGGHPTRSCRVTFGVGDRSRVLTVVGNRRWELRGSSWEATRAEPFTEMELRYERSFGGAGFGRNPVGVGSQRIVNEHGTETQQIPNLDDPREQTEADHSYADAAGFGPLRRTWETRSSKAGTFAYDYRETRWPWFPEDVDWGHFNAAPEEMQLDGYLKGDEKLYFENLHPVHSRYESRLPGLRVRCFVNRLTPPDSEHTEFVELQMGLDTLWVDMEAEKLVLVWRGWTGVASDDHAEVQDVFIMSESLAREPASADECYQAFLETQAAEKKKFEPTLEPVEPEDESPVPGPVAPAGPDARELEAQANAFMARMGIDVESLPPEAREKQSRLIRKLSETDPDKIADLEQQELDGQLRQALGELDLDPDHLPPVTARAKAEQFRFLKGMGVKDAHLGTDPELANAWAMMAAILPSLGMDPENLQPLIEQGRKLNLGFGEADDDAADTPDTPPLTREAVAERAERGESFAGEDLHGLDLSELDLNGLDFSAANLAQTKLTGANLANAILTAAILEGAEISGGNLTGANLARADLSSARLDGASLQGADVTMGNLIGASLEGAILTDATFEKAQMAGCVCNRAQAGDAIFVRADLTGVSFRNSDCSGADFSNATLDQAAFSRAKLVEASFEWAIARGIKLADADVTGLKGAGGDFTGAMFWRTLGEGSIWEGANLTGADFREARMPGTTLTRACLEQAILSGSDMRASKFTRAKMRGAHMVQMNLFEGSLEKADLTGADLSGSNMYGVEFLDAVLDGAAMSGTNVRMTKLATP